MKNLLKLLRSNNRSSTAFPSGHMLGLAFILLLAVVISLPLINTRAQGEPPRVPSDDEVNAVAKQMYCPVCENVPLDVCPTRACEEWRQLIREKLAIGWSEDRIRDYFVLQYGEQVLASPPARGLNWLVYIIPPLAFLGGVYVLYKAFTFNTRKKPQTSYSNPDPIQEPKDEYIQRLEDELRNLQEN